MLHGRDTHLLARATTLNGRGLPDGLPHGLRATLWCPFLTPTTPTLPLLAPKKPSIMPETHQNLPARAHQTLSPTSSLVVRTYILTPALSPTNGALGSKCY